MESINTNKLPIAFFPAAVDACALYRMFIPHLNIPNSRFLFRVGSLDSREFRDCKVAVVQRQVSDQNLTAMERMQEMGMKVIYDLDDNIWNLPDWNPGKQMFDQMLEGFKKCAAQADILTVSTPDLKKAAEKGFKLDKEIFIIPNAIDFNLFYRKENLARNDGVVLVGWQGSNTHSDDVSEAFDTIVSVFDTNVNARMQICGAPARQIVEKWETKYHKDGRLYRQRIRTEETSSIAKHPSTLFRPWVPVGEYANRLAGWGWDISLAPLKEHKFNRSKSAIKMLEAGALKIPCLASDVRPYREFAELGGKDLTWLLCSYPSQWKIKLHTLINDEAMRKELGQKMYETTKKYFDIKEIAKIWTYVFGRALGVA